MQLFQRYPGRTAAAALLALAALAACTDRAGNPAGPKDPDPTAPGAPGTPVTIQTLKCTASVPQKTVTCGPLAPDAGGASADVIVPGPNNTFVRLTSTNVDYSGATQAFTFDVTVRNLIDQPLGTTDGVALDPNGVRVFFLGSA
ncbi:MAG TPA: hypothetical protein VFQ39_09725, partial [Longimicrobium sp.]|nr:hypothetical protein [Longimicrobium sp.]